MNARETQRKIYAAQSRLGKLKPWRETLTAERDRLAVERPVRDPSGEWPMATLFEDSRYADAIALVEHGRGVNGDWRKLSPEVAAGLRELPGLVATEDEIPALEKRLLLLGQALPAAAAVEAGRQEIADALDRVAASEAAFIEHRAELVAALDMVEDLARSLAEHIDAAKLAAREAHDLAERYDLGLGGPAASRDYAGPEFALDEREHAELVRKALRELVVNGALAPTTEHGLAKLRSRHRRQEAA